jgi:hypothetical protein
MGKGYSDSFSVGHYESSLSSKQTKAKDYNNQRRDYRLAEETTFALCAFAGSLSRT